MIAGGVAAEGLRHAAVVASGAEPVSSTPDEMASLIKSEMARIAKVVKAAGIKAD